MSALAGPVSNVLLALLATSLLRVALFAIGAQIPGGRIRGLLDPMAIPTVEGWDLGALAWIVLALKAGFRLGRSGGLDVPLDLAREIDGHLRLDDRASMSWAPPAHAESAGINVTRAQLIRSVRPSRLYRCRRRSGQRGPNTDASRAARPRRLGARSRQQTHRRLVRLAACVAFQSVRSIFHPHPKFPER